MFTRLRKALSSMITKVYFYFVGQQLGRKGTFIFQLFYYFFNCFVLNFLGMLPFVLLLLVISRYVFLFFDDLVNVSHSCF